MTKEELRQLSRTDLVDLLLEITQENEQLRLSLDEAKNQLEDRTIIVEDPGNMAEAARLVNSILEAAQTAADQHLENIRKRDEQQRQVCIRMEQNAQKKCRRIKENAQAQVAACLNEISAYLRKINESDPWKDIHPDDGNIP